LVSGRPDNFRNVTEGWLKDNNISYDALYMRPAGDRRPDSINKKEIYLDQIEKSFDVLFVVDDRRAVVDMWRGLGLTVLHCANGDY
jgi:hypothetical protein